MPSGSTAVIAVFPVQPERVEEFLVALRSILPDTRNFEGCETIETYLDVKEPGRVVLWERWPSTDHHRRYLAWRNESGTAAPILEYLSGPPSFTYLEARADV